MLQSVGSQRVRHDLATEQQWNTRLGNLLGGTHCCGSWSQAIWLQSKCLHQLTKFSPLQSLLHNFSPNPRSAITSALLHPILGICRPDFTWWRTRWHWPLHPFFGTFTLLLLLFFVLAPRPHLLFVFYSPLWSHLSHIFKLFLSPQPYILGCSWVSFFAHFPPHTLSQVFICQLHSTSNLQVFVLITTRGLFIYLIS